MRLKRMLGNLFATLALINVVSSGHTSYVSNLYCPEGYRNLLLNNTQLVKGDWAGAFEEQCQCKGGAKCQRDVRSNSYSCRLVFSYTPWEICLLNAPCLQQHKELYRNFIEKQLRN